MPDPKDVNEGQYDEDPDDSLETVDDLSSKPVPQRKKVASKVGDLKGLVRLNKERGTFDCDQFSSHTPARKLPIRAALANPSIARASLAETNHTPIAPDLGLRVVKGVLFKISTSAKREQPTSALEKATKLIVWSAKHICKPAAPLGKHSKPKLDMQKSLKNASTEQNFPTKGQSTQDCLRIEQLIQRLRSVPRFSIAPAASAYDFLELVPFSTWLKAENYHYEPEPDYFVCSTSEWRLSNAPALMSKAPPERFFFQPGRPISIILNEWQRLSTPISHSKLMNNLDSQKSNSPVDSMSLYFFMIDFGPPNSWLAD